MTNTHKTILIAQKHTSIMSDISNMLLTTFLFMNILSTLYAMARYKHLPTYAKIPRKYKILAVISLSIQLFIGVVITWLA